MAKKIISRIGIVLVICIALVVLFYFAAFVWNLVCYHVGFPFNTVLLPGWKRVQFDNVGTLDIPFNWEYVSDGESSVIVDKSGAPIFTEFLSKTAYIDGNEVVLEEIISGEILSNSAYIAKYSTTNDDYEFVYCITLDNYPDGGVDLALCDESIDYKTLKWIACTFCQEYPLN